MVVAFPLVCNDSVGTFLVRTKFSLGAHHLSQDTVSELEVFVSDSRVVVLGHVILVLREPVFSCRLDFVY